MAKKESTIHATGRRKGASARARLLKGKGESTVNGVAIEKFFSGKVMTASYLNPFKLTDTLDKYYVTVRVVGGGVQGQLKAAVHAISRSLSTLSEENRLALKKAGLLTRDARIRERRKVGMGGKSRRKRQSPKR